MTNKTKSKAQLQQLIREFAADLEQLLAVYTEILETHSHLGSLVEQADPLEKSVIAKRTEILALAKELQIPAPQLQQLEARDYDALMESLKAAKETIH